MVNQVVTPQGVAMGEILAKRIVIAFGLGLVLGLVLGVVVGDVAIGFAIGVAVVFGLGLFTRK